MRKNNSVSLPTPDEAFAECREAISAYQTAKKKDFKRVRLAYNGLFLAYSRAMSSARLCMARKNKAAMMEYIEAARKIGAAIDRAGFKVEVPTTFNIRAFC